MEGLKTCAPNISYSKPRRSYDKYIVCKVMNPNRDIPLAKLEIGLRNKIIESYFINSHISKYKSDLIQMHPL